MTKDRLATVKSGRDEKIPFTTRTRMFAERLLVLEASLAERASESVVTDFHVSEKLVRPLASFAGAAAFHAMLSRALALTKAEYPRLTHARLTQNGRLEGLEQIEPALSREEAIAGELMLIGNIVELFCTLLGETLAFQLLQGVWTELTLTAEGSEKKGKV